MDFETIVTQAPNSWKDFLTFYREESRNVNGLGGIEFTALPFSLQLGVYIKYFYENGVEIDLANIEYDNLQGSILQAFLVQEKVIKHYS